MGAVYTHSSPWLGLEGWCSEENATRQRGQGSPEPSAELRWEQGLREGKSGPVAVPRPAAEVTSCLYRQGCGWRAGHGRPVLGTLSGRVLEAWG